MNNSAILRTAMHEILSSSNFLSQILAPICNCADDDDLVLAELGAVVSDPGAPAQDWHPDTAYGGPACICCFVTLQPTDATMGPTDLLPATHTFDFHQQALRNFPPKGIMSSAVRPKSMTPAYATTGDACLMDGAKRATRERRHDWSSGCLLLYSSFEMYSGAWGFLFTVRKELSGKQLVSFMKAEET
jgi:ectoine hydroxylase-related dioxygenase (phytanoyl-CoA dioxygenase family)